MTKKKWPTVGKGQRHIRFIQTTPDARIELGGLLIPDAIGDKIFRMLLKHQVKAPKEPKT